MVDVRYKATGMANIMTIEYYVNTGSTTSPRFTKDPHGPHRLDDLHLDLLHCIQNLASFSSTDVALYLDARKVHGFDLSFSQVCDTFRCGDLQRMKIPADVNVTIKATSNEVESKRLELENIKLELEVKVIRRNLTR